MKNKIVDRIDVVINGHNLSLPVYKSDLVRMNRIETLIKQGVDPETAHSKVIEEWLKVPG